MTVHYIDSRIDTGDTTARKGVVLALLLLIPAALPTLPAAADHPFTPGKTVETGQNGAEKSVRPMIEGIRVETGVADKVGIFFKLSGFVAPKCFSLVGQDRKLVCDFMETGFARNIEPNITVESDLVFRVRVGRHEEPERKTRVVLDMDRVKSYDVEQLFVRGKNEYVLVIKPLAGKGKPRTAP